MPKSEKWWIVKGPYAATCVGVLGYCAKNAREQMVARNGLTWDEWKNRGYRVVPISVHPIKTRRGK